MIVIFSTLVSSGELHGQLFVKFVMILFYKQRHSLSVFQCNLILLYCVATTSAGGFEDTYDFVIVGGGTAGCVVASRLSENGKHSVLLLEAGGEPHPDLDIPALSNRYSDDLQYVRKYESVPQANAALRNNGTVEISQGRTLGGSSSINGMIWNRGSPYDFDNWARLTNDSSWSYSNLHQFFKKSENYMGRFPSDQHWYGGPVTVSRPSYAPLLQEWLQAGRYLGYPNGDPNGPQKISYTSLEFSKRLGRRVNSYSGYLKPVMERRNLRVLTGADATQIIFEGKRATGVRYQASRQSGRQYTRQVFARKEVIVSAGAIESPALLMRSGIGPKHVLEAANIPKIMELPVGQGLQNHVAVVLKFVVNNASLVFDPDRDLNPATMEIFSKYGDGPYSFNGFVAQSISKSSVSKDEPKWADIVTRFISSVDVPQHQRKEPRSPLAEWEVPIGAWITIARPRSRGSIVLNPVNPSGLPLVDFKYFTDESGQDMHVLIEGIKIALDTFERTPSFRKLGARYPPEDLEPCRNVRFRSDAYWQCYVRHVSPTGFHPCGTNRMGRGAEDRDAVVDSKLKVIGVKDLRVVDASIMPTIPTTNIQAPVYAIAEKAAQMILRSWE